MTDDQSVESSYGGYEYPLPIGARRLRASMRPSHCDISCMTSPVVWLTFRTFRGRRAWSDGECCIECNCTSERRIPPLIMVWEFGSATVGDFTATAACDGFAVKASVYRKLRALFDGFKSGPVEMIEEGHQRPRKTNRPSRKIRLPYTGEKLVELWLKKWVHADPKRSTMRLTSSCSTCGRKDYELSGQSEVIDYRMNKKLGRLTKVKRKRKPGHGVFVHKSEVATAGLFGIHEFSGWVFCTDAFKQAVESMKLTNIDFIDMGEAV